MYFCQEQNMLLRMKLFPLEDLSHVMGETTLFFRGIHTSQIRVRQALRYPCWDIEADLWQGRASETINISRSNLREDGFPETNVKRRVYEKLLKVADEALEAYITRLSEQLDNEPSILTDLEQRLYNDTCDKEEYQRLIFLLNDLFCSLYIHTLTIRCQQHSARLLEPFTKVMEWLRKHLSSKIRLCTEMQVLSGDGFMRSDESVLDFFTGKLSDYWMLTLPT